jgi:Cu/Ag efflux protein CusF
MRNAALAGLGAGLLAFAGAAWAAGETQGSTSKSAGGARSDPMTQQDPTAGPKTQGSVGRNDVQGTVKSIDKDAKTLTLSSGQSVKCGDDTKVLRDNAPASFKDIKEGDTVHASFSGGQGESVQRIEVTSQPGAKQPQR